jgi:carboxyl-terminal processing protease
MRTFTYLIPDAHVGISFNSSVFSQEQAGGLGLVLEELSDGRIIVEQVLPGFAGDEAGIEVGAELVSWDGQPVAEALDVVFPFFGPFSNESLKRVEQINHLPRGPVGRSLEVSFQNPGGEVTAATLVFDFEIDSLFAANPFYETTAVAAPLQAEILPDTNIGYVRIDSFSDDPNMAGRLWVRALEEFNELGVEGIIIDLRLNGGGFGGLAFNMAEYLYDEEVTLWGGSSYNDLLGEFEPPDRYVTLEPQEFSYDGEVVLLISPYCISACEGFAYALTSTGRAIAIGHDATAGAYGAVGGQYKVPGDYDMQFPTVRSLTPDGVIVLEDVGVIPDILVPVTYDEVVNGEDALFNAALEELQ